MYLTGSYPFLVKSCGDPVMPPVYQWILACRDVQGSSGIAAVSLDGHTSTSWAASRIVLCQHTQCSAELLLTSIPDRGVPTYTVLCRAALWHSSVLEMNKEVDLGRKLNPRFQMPLLVLFGDTDSAVTLNVLRKIGRVAADVTVQVIPDSSHWVQQDAPEEVNRLLRAFVERKGAFL